MLNLHVYIVHSYWLQNDQFYLLVEVIKTMAS